MTKTEVKAIIHEVMERYILHAEEIDDELIDENRKIFSINKTLCQAIDDYEEKPNQVKLGDLLNRYVK